MRRILASELSRIPEGISFIIAGRVTNIGDNTIDVRDSTGVIKIRITNILEKQSRPLSLGAMVKISGSRKGNTEVIGDSIDIISSGHYNSNKDILPFDSKSYLRLSTHGQLELLRQRNTAESIVRDFLQKEHFLEISTPLLWCSVQEYGEPELKVSHTEMQGRGFALVQSPLQPSILAAIGGADRIFQFARCFRFDPEYPVAQNALEFTQLSIVSTFTDLSEGKDLIERLLIHLIERLVKNIQTIVFNRMKYNEVLGQYGTESPYPSLGLYYRFNLEHLNKYSHMNHYECLAFDEILSEDTITILMSTMKKYIPGSSKWGIALVEKDKVSYVFQEMDIPNELNSRLFDVPLRVPYYVILLKGYGEIANEILMSILRAVRFSSKTQLIYDFLWVEDFPFLHDMYKDNDRKAGYHCSRSLFGKRFTKESTEYVIGADLILNGVEVATISEKENCAIQFQRSLDLCNCNENKEKYAPHIEALEQGAPPVFAAGIGWERLLWQLLRTPSVHDLIFLPKDSLGRCGFGKIPIDVDFDSQ